MVIRPIEFRWTIAASLIFAGFVHSGPAMATDCTPADITLSSQAAVDDFQDDHGPCDRVVGMLDIDGASIDNVDGLTGLVEVGNLRFLFTAELDDLSGLAGLTTVNGSLFFTDCDVLGNVDGLSGLTSVGGVVRFSFMNSLQNLDGLSNLASAGGIHLEFNTALTDIDGLSSISAVTGNVVLESNIALLNLDGLSGLQAVDGSFRLIGHTRLANAAGLSSLGAVGGDFQMEFNPLLAQCRSLAHLLDGNDHGAPGPGVGEVPDVGGAVSIGGNLTGCNSIDEIINPIFANGFDLPDNTITVVDDPANKVGDFISLAIGADGHPIISYGDTTAGALKVAKCHDVQCSGGNQTITQIEDPPGVVVYTAISVGTDGLPVIGYNNGLSLKVASCNDEFCAGGDETITVLDSSPIGLGFYLSLTHGMDGFPVMSYYDDDADQLRVAKCSDPTCAAGPVTITVVDSATFAGRYTSIAIGNDGFPVVSYVDGNGDLKVAKCNDAACAGGDESITVVDEHEGSESFQGTSLAVADDGFPVISYYDRTYGTLKAAKCNDVACAGGDEIISIVDSSSRSAFSAIAIGSDGLPIISYNARPFIVGGSLKTAKCNDPACSGGDEIIHAVDDPPNGDVGAYSTIAIGSDGLPVVGYVDSLAGALKVLHCGNLNCGRP